MTEKEQYQQSKKLAIEKKNKLKLLKVMLVDKNMKFQLAEEEEKLDLLGEINTLSNEIISLKNNKNNSKFYEWKPFVGLNRRQRRMK